MCFDPKVIIIIIIIIFLQNQYKFIWLFRIGSFEIIESALIS